MELSAAITTQTMKYIAGETLAVNSDQHRAFLDRHLAARLHADSSQRQRQMNLRINHGAIGEEIEFAVCGRQLQGEFSLAQPLPRTAQLDNLLDGAHFQAVLAGKFDEVGQSCHVTIGLDDFAENGCALQTSQRSQVDAPLRMTGANKHPAFAGAQTIHVSLAPNQIVWRRPV